VLASWTLLPAAASAQGDDHAASSAPAPSPSARATARSLAREGADAQKKGNYALAADRFERAEALVDAPTLLLGLARAQVGLGKLVEADETYRRIARAQLSPGSPPAFGRAVEDANSEAPAVAARRAWVTVVVQGPSTPTVLIDDVSVPGAAIGIRLACNPGPHIVKATAPGFAPAEQPFAIAEGTSQTIQIPMQRDVPEVAPVRDEPRAQEPTPLPSSPPPEETSSTRTTVGVTVLGVGLAGLVVGGVTGIITLAKHGSLSDSCPDGHCTADQSGALSTYRTVADVSTVTTIIGAVGTAAGLTILLTAPSRPSQVGVYAGPMSAGLAGRF
jgi:hypothetical protein